MEIKSISIVIPSYNESKKIASTLTKIVSYMNSKKLCYEIIVVDDGSTDNSNEIVKELSEKNNKIKPIRNQKNKGKGYSVRKGVLNSKYDLILFTDADLSTPITELDNLMVFLDNYDMIIGSRNLKGSKIKIKQPFYRRIPGKIFPLLVNLIMFQDIRDTQCGFKLFKRKAAIEIFNRQKLNGFSFDVEVLYLAKELKLKIKEAPIVWMNDINSKINPIRDPYKMFKELLRIKFNVIMGKYKY